MTEKKVENKLSNLASEIVGFINTAAVGRRAHHTRKRMPNTKMIIVERIPIFPGESICLVAVMVFGVHVHCT